MAADAVIARAYLPPGAPHTSGDVGALHHNMFPDVSGLFDPDCCFFVSAGQPSGPRTEIPRLKTASLNSLCLSVSNLGQGVELSSGKNCLAARHAAWLRLLRAPAAAARFLETTMAPYGLTPPAIRRLRAWQTLDP
jgi:hypothetical protein